MPLSMQLTLPSIPMDLNTFDNAILYAIVLAMMPRIYILSLQLLFPRRSQYNLILWSKLLTGITASYLQTIFFVYIKIQPLMIQWRFFKMYIY